MVKAFLQKGRGKPGLILPANAVAKINESADRSALVRAAEYAEAKAAEPMIDVAAAVQHAEKAIAATLAVPEELMKPEPLPGSGLTMVGEPEPEDFEDKTVVTPNPFTEPDTEPEEDGDTEPDAKPYGDQDLTQISGVGPALEKRLQKFGFISFEKIAAADPAVLNEIPGAKGRGERWVTEARKLLNA